jgi:hypothetical protein
MIEFIYKTNYYENHRFTSSKHQQKSIENDESAARFALTEISIGIIKPDGIGASSNIFISPTESPSPYTVIVRFPHTPTKQKLVSYEEGREVFTSWTYL